ncbi:hypothetical protein Tco_0996557 [Tanacetum coccineum]
MYMIFSHMLKSFDREDLESLYKLVKAKYKLTRPAEDLDLVLWNDLKTMLEPHVEDAIWRNQQDYKVLSWKLYDSCELHFLRMQHMQIYMLVEKKYPLTPSTLTMMLEKKLMIDYESKMAYQLLKFIVKQLKNLLDAVRIIAAKIYVNTALMKLVLLMDFKVYMLRTVRFENDHVAAIQGYRDLEWGNILITRVSYVKGLGHNLFSFRQFYDADLEV